MTGIFDRLQTEIETRQRVEGITPADLLDLSPELRRIINMILRQGEMSLTEIVLELDMKPSEVKGLLDTLLEKGYLKAFEVKGEQRYKTFLARKRRREVPLDIWEALGSKVE
jgi:DNA-binding MarR family transcriptional regulator